MPSENWRRLQELFEEALTLPEAERADYLNRSCGEDGELRARVAALLVANESTLLIERVVGSAAADVAFESVAPGSTVGRYEVIAALGRGGVGHVYRARDPALGREVAIKLLNPAVLATPSGRVRFEREARASAALKHPNIVTIHDVGEDSGKPFIVMELVEGETLRSRLSSGGAAEHWLPWGVQIAAALSAAHGAGVAHRDLKPENVIIDVENRARIVDFGLARHGAEASSESAPGATTVGMIMGTFGYMSPEALSGGPTDHRADQFALGAILYEMATGKRLFEGKTPKQMAAATLSDEPPDLQALSGTPPELRAAIVRCLACRPEDRFEQTSELHAILSALAEARLSPGLIAASLPKPRTELIGRDNEREAVRRLLVDQRVRLVTLTGPGGSGKTRLAMEVARDLSEAFGSRVFFVELAAIRDPRLVLPTIARALGAGGEHSPINAIRVELSGTTAPSLVILDNFEHLTQAGRDLGELLAKVDNLALLVTSREILRIYGEYDFPVEPLAFPRGNTMPPLAELVLYPAVALFVARARAATPSFELTAENAAAVVELCARLDGLPLALELAAARARMLSPRAMLKRLSGHRSLLATGARDLPARQQTLRATIEWSHELLDDAQMKLFRRLGVFVGGFSLEAVEAVADGYQDLDGDVIEAVASLVDKSLIQAVEGPGNENRFILLETIREFSYGKLVEHGERDRIARAHAAYFVVLAEEGGAALARESSAEWLLALRVEQDNCRAALEWLTEHEQVDWGLRLALGLFDFWDRSGQLIEGQLRFSKLLALDSSHEHSALRAAGLFSAAAFAVHRGLPTEAAELQSEAYELYRELGDLRGQAVTLNAIGIAASSDTADIARARDAFTRALELWREIGDETGFTGSLSNLAWVLKTVGEREEARRIYRQARELFDSGGKAIDAAWAMNHEADVAIENGDLDDGCRLYRDALERFEELGYHWGIATTLADLASVAGRENDPGEAKALARRALQIFVEIGHKRGISRLLDALAVTAHGEGRAETGLILAGCAECMRQGLGVRLSEDVAAVLQGEVERMRRAAGPMADEAWGRGLSWTVDAVVREALGF